MKPSPKATLIARFLKEQFEYLKEGAEYSQFSTFLERRKLLTSIYTELFGKITFADFASANRHWKMMYDGVSVSFETPDFSIQKETFIEASPLNLQCRLEQDGELYTLTLPLHRHNIEAYLVGLLTTNKEPLFLNYLDASVISKGFLSPTSYKWLTRDSNFLEIIYPEEYAWVNRLTDAFFTALEELNILHMQYTFMNGRATVTMTELELLNQWSHYYVRFYEDLTFNPNSPDNRLFEFNEFVSWSMLTGYKSAMKVSLIQHTKGFTPDNVTWSKDTDTKKRMELFRKQRNEPINTSDLLTIGQSEKTLEEWSAECDVDVSTLSIRYAYGMNSIDMLRAKREKAIVETNYRNQEFRIGDETKKLHEWAKSTRIPLSVLTERIKAGLNEADLLLPYKGSRRT